MLIGVLVVFLLPRTLALPTRALMGWDIGVGINLVFSWVLMWRSTHALMQKRARQLDDGAVIVLLFTLIATIASMGAIVLELLEAKSLPAGREAWHVGLAAGTIVLSWFFVHTSFALHYAHEFYARHAEGTKPCLNFPNDDPKPAYSDFLYFSFVIGATSQTSDVTISSPVVRRLVLAHGIIAFFFNTTLLAMAVNVAASLV
jgi:uncharacterized membrane protein